MKKIELIIDPSSATSKYFQIINYINELIKTGGLTVGDSLPSVRQFCKSYNLSQETVIKAFNELKSLGVLKSELRKGYFVASTNINYKKNVFFLFDELSEYKKILYNAIRDGLDPKIAKIDVFFHHCNADLFETLITNNINNYNVFVIMPFKDDKITASLAKLNGKNVLFLDRKEYVDESCNNFIAQDFNQSVSSCLDSIVDLINKYKKFILVFPDTKSVTSNAAKAPKEIIEGFTRFCRQNNINFEVVNKVDEVNKNESFFVIDDADLVSIITKGREKGYQLGKEIGLLSYNDSPIKSVVADGITVISTNYKKLGEDVVSYILEDTKEVHKIVDTELIIRNSL